MKLWNALVLPTTPCQPDIFGKEPEMEQLQGSAM